MSAPKLRIAIIGGGIGGLTLALALRQRGVAGAEVFEQAQELTEIGAAVALSANATRELRRLGVLDAIEAVATEPTELIFRDWRTGRRIAAHPVRQDSRYCERFGAPYLGIHRADLQRILSGALGGEGGLVTEAQRARSSATRANTAFEVLTLRVSQSTGFDQSPGAFRGPVIANTFRPPSEGGFGTRAPALHGRTSSRTPRGSRSQPRARFQGAGTTHPAR